MRAEKMKFINGIVLNFDTINTHPDTPLDHAVERGYRVVCCETVSPKKLAVSWDYVALSYVRVRSDNLDYALKTMQAVSMKTPVIALLHVQKDSEIANTLVQQGAAAVLSAKAEIAEHQGAFHHALRLRKTRKELRSMAIQSEKYETLSQLQKNIVQLAADGESNKRIAKLLGLSINTIEKERRKAYGRLGARNYAEMIRTVVLAEIFESAAGQKHYQSLAPLT